MVCAQLFAFGKVSQSREERREQREKRKQEKKMERLQIESEGAKAKDGKRFDLNGDFPRMEVGEALGWSDDELAVTEEEMIL